MTDPYLQRSGALVNRLGVEDPERLETIEDAVTALRIRDLELGFAPLRRMRGLEDLKRIHGYLFGDIYPWAGSTRAEPYTLETSEGPVTIPTMTSLEKGGDAFAPPWTIDAAMAAVRERISRHDGLANLERRDLIVEMADILVALNNMHPFREGNGRAQRAFVKLLAREAGRAIDFRVVTRERMIRASIAGARGDPEPMRRLVRDAATPERIGEMRRAQRKLDELGYDWREGYIAFAEPGRLHDARFVGREGRQFLCVEGGDGILVGWSADLPDGPLARDQRFAFTARAQSSRTAARGATGRAASGRDKRSKS